MSDKTTKPDNRGKPTSEELKQTIQIAQEICVRWIAGGQQPPKDLMQKAFQYAEEFVEKAREYRKGHTRRPIYPSD